MSLIDSKKLAEFNERKGPHEITEDEIIELCSTCEALWKVAKAAEVLANQFKAISEDHYGKLVHNQTFESAQENWGDLKQGPLEFGSLLESLAALREGEK